MFFGLKDKIMINNNLEHSTFLIKLTKIRCLYSKILNKYGFVGISCLYDILNIKYILKSNLYNLLPKNKLFIKFFGLIKK